MICMWSRSLPPRRLALAAWLCGLLSYITVYGLPSKRVSILLWVGLAVAALGVDQPRSTLRAAATTWLPLFAALGAYDVLRGASHGEESAAHTWPQLDLDLWLGQGQTPTQHLQAWAWSPGAPHWWDYLAWAVYQSHFFMPLAVAVVLWHRRQARASAYIAGIAALSWAALATYWLYPAQPPWMTARDGLTGPVVRIVHEMWHGVGAEGAARVFATDRNAGRHLANTVAALPSLHAGFPLFIAVMLWGLRSWLNPAVAAYALAMGLVLVYTGEHFVFDVVLGWGYAAAVALVARWQAAHRHRQGARVEAAATPAATAAG